MDNARVDVGVDMFDSQKLQILPLSACSLLH